MKLVADSGSTKTTWALLSSDGELVTKVTTQGINPVYRSDDEICNILRNELPPAVRQSLSALYFYGSGCRPDQTERMTQLLGKELGVKEVSVASDLLGACLALSADEESICCILGTGSASCHFSGTEIISQVPSLGYILGDEGSGASIGRHLIADILKRQLPEHLCLAWQDEMGIGVAEAIDHTYRQPNANRWLASLTHWISAHAEDATLQNLLETEFRRFTERNLLAYKRPDLPIHFTGSIAHHFRTPLEHALQSAGLTMGHVIQYPIDGLIAHLQQ